MAELLLLLVGGLLAGTLGGLLGIGGGIVLMPLLRFGVGLSPAFSAGTCILAVFFTTAGGSYRHFKLGNIDLRSVAPIVIAGVAASAATSSLFHAVAVYGRWLDLGIGLVFLLVSTRMVVESLPCLPAARADRNSERRVGGNLPQRIGVGAVAGGLPGLLGIGTGGILVPAITFLLKTSVKTAMAASLFCFCFTALVSAAFKSVQGYVDWRVALPVCTGALVGANLGALLNNRCSSALVKAIFACLFLYVSIRFILAAFEGTSR